MLKNTPLHEQHIHQHASMVNFAGWEMPLHYGSQIEEHHCVRNDAGIFDVSHMGVIDVEGEGAGLFLQYIFANNIGKLKAPGSALYTCMLNEQGGVKDDLIVYFIAPNRYRLVVNASTTEKDLQWLLKQAASFSVEIKQREDLAIMAIQGPNSLKKWVALFPDMAIQINALKSFQFFRTLLFSRQKGSRQEGLEKGSEQEGLEERESLISKTGYTGEEGLEIILPQEDAGLIWSSLVKAGVQPVGLGARDTLRLEAGLNLYGQDMDEQVTPLESNLSWTLAFEPESRDFIGRAALIQQLKEGIKEHLVGVILLDKGVLRHDQSIFSGKEFLGKITSGSYSPTLKQSIALARLRFVPALEVCEVDIRNRRLQAKIVKPPFVRRKVSGRG